MKMRNFIKNPDVTIYKGFIVDENSTLSYETKNGNIKQELKNLEFTQVQKIVTDNCDQTINTIIHLKPGMVVLFEDEKRGYVVPVERFVRISEAIEDLNYIIDLDKEV